MGNEATPSDAEQDLLSIGDLAEATGIGPDTIRVWERRYGRPQAVRLPSGHRRYTEEHVRWLRRIAEALAHGYRPSKVVYLDESALDEILAPGPETTEESDEVRRLIALLRDHQTVPLRRELSRKADEMGPVTFLRECVGPLMTGVGRSWADGDVGIRHEHLLTEVVEDVLRSLRQGLPTPEGGPLLLLATLPEEQHGLGLQMVALLATLAGVRTRNLGQDVPLDEIEHAARETQASAVAVSVSLATGGIHTDRLLADLRKRLPDEVDVVVGGAGARGVRRGPRGIEYVLDWDALDAWLQTFRCDPAKP